MLKQATTTELVAVSESKGQTSTGGGGEGPLSKAEVRRFKELAKRITGDIQFQAILNTAPFDQRETLYDQIVPWLSFPAKSFDDLRFF